MKRSHSRSYSHTSQTYHLSLLYSGLATLPSTLHNNSSTLHHLGVSLLSLHGSKSHY